MEPKKVLCFGELLMRICPDPEGKWLQNNQAPLFIGGAEANVAAALALWDIPAAYLTALPRNAMSTQIYAHLEKKGIDLSRTIYQGDRLGLYYLPMGVDMKNAEVIYDRLGSSFAGLKVNTVDWDLVFEDIGWFHFSAICPAINEEVAAVCLEAVRAAAAKGIPISLDLNYRPKLWQYGKTPEEIMTPLAHYCTLIMGNIWAAERMLGIEISPVLIENGNRESMLLQAERSSTTLLQQFPSCKALANTFRFDEGKGIQYYSCLYAEDQLYASSIYHADQVYNKVGSGDCYMAGLIYGFYQQNAFPDIVEFATAAAYNKLFIVSDATSTQAEDIRKQMKK